MTVTFRYIRTHNLATVCSYVLNCVQFYNNNSESQTISCLSDSDWWSVRSVERLSTTASEPLMLKTPPQSVNCNQVMPHLESTVANGVN